ncbi:MAG: heparinase II/III family protein [Bacteroidales bacterium]|jgi:hypothetical protein|nr:heparinase II/III family protein [Bacteroidales bacterium]
MSLVKKYLLLLIHKSPRYLLFRSKYEIERKCGFLTRKFPVSPSRIELPSLKSWKAGEPKYFFADREHLNFPKEPIGKLKSEAEHILKGEIKFFGRKWYDLGENFDWVTNPDSGFHYDIRKHWTKIDDFSKVAGDIKFVWEKSRFSYLYTIIRYDYHFDADHSEFVISQILDWIDKNPLNCGPNYKCSQEISIRVQNWLFALYFYKNSSSISEGRWNKIITSIYWQIDHVYKNINFSRIAVRNNHAITETLTLYLIGLLFPQFPNAGKWKKNGKRWFEKEISYQIADDGTFIQDSMNYHRVLIQLMTWAIALADRNGEKYSDFVYEKAYNSVNFLYQCQDMLSGYLPNYGSNDGALFFPLSNNDYRDYRPQLDALYGLLTGCSLYGEHFEDALWVGYSVPSFRKSFALLKQQEGMISFKNSGYYLIREPDMLTFIRCGSFNGSGPCTDEFHMDVWYKGENVLLDGGSYKYNTEECLEKYFRGTESHNTIMLDNYDQMLKGPRFVWYYPPKIKFVSLTDNNGTYEFNGKVKCFSYLGNIAMNRTVMKKKGIANWIVVDRVIGKGKEMRMRQLWHTLSDRIAFTAEIDSDRKEEIKPYSYYYGEKSNCKQIEFVTKGSMVKTVITIK